MKNIVSLNVDNYDKVHEDGIQTHVIYFSASWCLPCQRMKCTFSELVQQLADNRITFSMVDIAESPSIAQRLVIRTVPTIAILHQGILMDVIVGETPLGVALVRVKHALNKCNA